MNGRAAWLDWVGLDGSEREDGEGEEKGERGKVEERREGEKFPPKIIEKLLYKSKGNDVADTKAYLDFTRGRLSWPPLLTRGSRFHVVQQQTAC
jgi:hypothetical protein